jgi:hypothetical protein
MLTDTKLQDCVNVYNIRLYKCFKYLTLYYSIYVLYVMTCSTSYCLETAYGSMECIYVYMYVCMYKD